MSEGMSINWTQFFKDAGILPSIAKRYCITFEDNRISKDMLLDLNKEILREMGISAMGDVINILKYAKKLHSQDTKKKDNMLSTAPKTVIPSNRRPPPPTAHSTTTPGQASTVSTTSSSAAKKKKIIAKYAKRELPDSLSPELQKTEPNVTYIALVEPGREEVLLPPHSIRSSNKNSSLDDTQQDTEYYIETNDLHPEMMEGCDIQKSYEYEARKLKKRPMTMYSDDPAETSVLKHSRVIILPGEGKDIFTTTALEKAAKEYESGEEQVGRVATDRSRRLLESAGLIPSMNKNPGNSVFSRLDYKPSVVTSLTPANTSSSELITQDPSPRIIKLSRSSSGTHTASSSSKQSLRTVMSGSSPKRKVTSSDPPPTLVSTIPTSTSTKVLPKRLAESQSISRRLGTRSTSKLVSDRLHDRDKNSASNTVISASRSIKTRPSQRMERSGLYATLVEQGGRVKVKKSTMVADEYEYQTQHQQDIRSRLERKESEKRSRRGGPLAGRLASHKIFGRLE